MLDIRRNSHRILFIMRIDKTQLTSADRKLTDRVRRKFREGIRTYHLIAPGDHVLVGLSGGKDSMALLQLLGEYRRHAAQPFGLSALHVRMQGIDYRTDARYLEDFAHEQGADFYLQSCEMPTDRNARRTPCFLCSQKGPLHLGPTTPLPAHRPRSPPRRHSHYSLDEPDLQRLVFDHARAASLSQDASRDYPHEL